MTVDHRLAASGLEALVALKSYVDGLPTKTQWFKFLILGMVRALSREQLAFTESLNSSVPEQAWACRNVWELDVFIAFALSRQENARRLFEDLWNDGDDLLLALHDYLALEGDTDVAAEFDRMRAQLSQGMTEHGVTRRRYTKTNQMAEETGLNDRFSRVNKLTSKFVHPTAFSILVDPGSEYESAMRSVLIEQSAAAVIDACDRLGKHLEVHGLEPAP